MARRRRLVLGTLAAILLLGGGAVVVVPPLLFSDGVDYSHAPSITQTRAYQDAALLERAWSLPVAAIYKKDGVDFQRNGSFCGPTSAVNVMRSLGERADQQSILGQTGLVTIFGVRFGGVTLD